MNEGRFVFSQLISLCSHNEFRRCSSRYDGDKGARKFRSWHQFLCLVFGQLTQRESLREICTCLNAQGSRLYHLGFPKQVPRSTFSEAINRRDSRIFRDFAHSLITEAQRLYENDQQLFTEVIRPVYAMDASLIRLCLRIYPWADRQRNAGAVKIHTLYNIGTQIPEVFELTSPRLRDQWLMDKIQYTPGAFYIMDKGYMKLVSLYQIAQAGAFFVIRSKRHMKFKRIGSLPRKQFPDLTLHQLVEFETRWSRKRYPARIRRIKSRDPETRKKIDLLTNDLAIEPNLIAEMYRQRWQIELFFKWIKQHLRIKAFWGRSENAIRSQIWTALATYLLVAIARKRLQIPHSMFEILQILSITPFSKTPLNQLFSESGPHKPSGGGRNQLSIF